MLLSHCGFSDSIFIGPEVYSSFAKPDKFKRLTPDWSGLHSSGAAWLLVGSCIMSRRFDTKSDQTTNDSQTTDVRLNATSRQRCRPTPFLKAKNYMAGCCRDVTTSHLPYSNPVTKKKSLMPILSGGIATQYVHVYPASGQDHWASCSGDIIFRWSRARRSDL